MKKLLMVVIWSLLLSTTVVLTKNSTQIDTDVKKMRIITQEFTKNYFYIQQNIQISSAKRGLKSNILALDKTINSLRINIKDEEKITLVEFIEFSVDELKIVIKDKLSLENGGLVLDYTEAMLEGVENLNNKTLDMNNMLDVLNEMKFLLERASKYYIAFSAGYKDFNNIDQAQKAVLKFETLLSKLQSYNYPTKIKKDTIDKLLKYWPVGKKFYLGIKNSKLPTIVFISTKYINTALNKLIGYHKK
ncbi:MAG: hypothetical protein QM493_04455 [Sulfurovum sp.]